MTDLLYLAAFNLASFCVKKSGLDHAGSSGRTVGPNWKKTSGSSSSEVVGGEGSNSKKNECLTQIVDVYIGLMFKIKRDALLYLPFVSGTQITITIQAT